MRLTCKGLIVLSFLFLQITLGAQTRNVKIYPGSVISDVSNRPVGINLNFLMDGGRFPNPEQTVTEALRDMGVKYLRYPGGEKSDLNLFSVPPYEKSEPTLARTAGLEDYRGVLTKEGKFVFDPLDFDEFMAICQSVKAEPVVVVPADNYLRKPKAGERLSSRNDLLKHAEEWVRYANIKKKYGVRYWMVGNESWNQNNPNSTGDIYAQDVIDFSKAMKAVDSTIVVVANVEGKEFTKTVVMKAAGYADRLCVSNYGVSGYKRGYTTYRDTAQVLIRPILSAIEVIAEHGTPDQKKDLKIIVAEFGTIDWFKTWAGDNDMGHSIVNFDMAGQLLLRDEVEFSCFWNTRWIENESKPGIDHDALDKDGDLNPTGVAIKIWGNFLSTKMVRTEADGPIISYSSYDSESGKLFVYLVNKSEDAENVKVSLEGYETRAAAHVVEYFGSSAEDKRPLWRKGDDAFVAKVHRLKGTSITVFEATATKKPYRKPMLR